MEGPAPLRTLGDVGARAPPDETLQALLLGKARDDGPSSSVCELNKYARKNIVEVQPRKQLERGRAASPFTQMVQERSGLAGPGLSEADRKMMKNPQFAVRDRRGEGIAAQIVGISAPPVGGSAAFVSEKLFQRQRQLSGAADSDLAQILSAQNNKNALALEFPKKGVAGKPNATAGMGAGRCTVLPSMEVEGGVANVPLQVELPGQNVRRPRNVRPRPTSLPSMDFEGDGGEAGEGSHLSSKMKRSRRGQRRGSTPALGGTADDDFDFEEFELPDTEPVNRKKAASAEPATEEERMQMFIEKTCSQCRHGRHAEVKQALEKRFPIDAQDKDGNTLLIIACQNNHKKIVKMLMKQGADPKCANHKGRDAGYYARKYGYEAVLEDAKASAAEGRRGSKGSGA